MSVAMGGGGGWGWGEEMTRLMGGDGELRW